MLNLAVKIQLDPASIREVWLEPNGCFTIIGQAYDGTDYLYLGNKGKVELYNGIEAVNKRPKYFQHRKEFYADPIS